MFGQNFRHQSAEPAVDVVFFDRHHQLKWFTSPNELLHVQGFDRGHVQYPCGNAFRLKQLRRFDTTGALRAG